MTSLPVTNWIWLPDYDETVRNEPVVACFRKVFQAASQPNAQRLKISADTRYKLYVNGHFIEYGPARGDKAVWFADEVDITPWVVAGENVLAVEVLRYPLSFRLGNFGMARTTTPGLYIKDLTDNGLLTTDDSWKCITSPERRLRLELRGLDPLLVCEDWTSSDSMRDWTKTEFDDSGWNNAQPYNIFQITESACPGDLSDRRIPSMEKKPGRFLGLVPKYTSQESRQWNALLSGKGSVCVPAHTTTTVEIDAGEIITGFLALCAAGGAGATVKILCAESYYTGKTFEINGSSIREKGDRSDSSGILHGTTDICRFTSAAGEATWESYWYRTFRFVQLEIETQDAPLEILGFDYQLTGYPLEVTTVAEASDPDFADIWDISLRTLRRCMQETYVDCPFYEQLQYIMDTRSQALFTYSLSRDDRLARQALESFKRSQRSDGLLNACYPYGGAGVIPGFSIYYILMLHDHMMYFGDKELIRSHLGTVDEILHFFDAHLDARRLVGRVGGLLSDRYWSFIDWATAWKENLGVPPAYQQGPLTMESMLYVYGLQHAAELCDYIDRSDTADEYRARSADLQNALKQYCRDASGLYQDGPGVAEYSQHAQVFAVLNDMVSPETGKELLYATLRQPDKFAQCTVASMFYLFRALEKVGSYEHTERLWDAWRGMLKKNLTTCVENTTDERSDCHAWGSLILYELPHVILGVRPGAPGYQKVLVKPTPGYLDWANGTVMTAWGDVTLSWRRDSDGRVTASVQTTDAVKEHWEVCDSLAKSCAEQ